MGFFGIVPDEIIHEFLIKFVRLIQNVDVPLNKLFLDSTIKSFQMAISLRVAGIVKIVG